MNECVNARMRQCKNGKIGDLFGIELQRR